MLADRESVLGELLLEWEERRQGGEAISAAQLCRDRPELIEELADRIRALESVYRIHNRGWSVVSESDTAHSDPARLPQVPGFEVIGVLGHGGMGVVYKARHERLNRAVALKMLRGARHARPIERLRFRIEAEAVAALQHPHIVQLFEVGEAHRCPFLVLEYVEGSTLAARLRAGPLDFQAAAQLVAALADAADYAHRRGVIHRDLKPGNILLTAEGTPKITDFGLAKRLTAPTDDSSPTGHTQTGDVLGTPGYMAPEQIAGLTRDIGPPADVYALGAILYECVVGRPPFQGVTPLETLRQAVDQCPVSPSQLRPGVPRDLATICLKCVEKEPAQRYDSAASLADDLRRFLGGEPIRARPVGWLEQTVKWAKRRPAVAALVAAVLGLLVIMALGGTTLAVIAMRARANALAAADGEKKSKEAAVARDKETSQVLSFVENKIFAAARPEGQMGGLGREVTLRKAIDAALPFVDKSFTNEPLIEARLRLTLGMSFYYLGDGARAAEQNERARALYITHLGPEHADTLRSMSHLANSYALLGRHEDARKLYEETLSLRKATLGPDHPDTLMNMNNLANSYYVLGQHDEALNLREKTLALQNTKLGSDHPDTLMSMNNLSTSYFALGRHEEAFTLREETLALRKIRLGTDHPETLRSMSNLANSYYALGRHEEALKLREETAALQQQKLGRDHPDTLTSMHNLSNSYYAVGRHEEALKLRVETLGLRQRKLGSDHPDTLMSMANLANSYADVGRHEDALKLRKEILAKLQGRFGSDHPDTLLSMYNLARSYADLGQYQEALDLHQTTVELRKEKLAPDHPDTFHSMREVASNLIHLDRGKEAVAIIDECVRRAAAKGGDPALISEPMELRLRYFEKAKDAAGCQATAEMWEQLNRGDADSLYTAARFRAVTSAVLKAADTQATRLAQDQADRAMNWLRKAVDAGYNNAAHMAEDKDFDALRDREDFPTLLTNLGDTGSKEK